MNKFDIVFLVLVVLSGLVGLIRGITKEILSLIAWVGAVTMAYVLFPLTQHVARTYITNPMLADGVTIFGIFLIFLVVLTLVSHFFTTRVRQSALSGVDRSLGFAYGILRAVLVLFVFELVVSCFWLRPDHPDFIKESRFANFMYKGSNTLYSVLPLSGQEWVKSLQEKRLSEKKTPSLSDIKQAGEVISQVETKIAPVIQAAIDQAAEKLPTAEELSNLKPKAQNAKSQKKNNTVKQDIEIDRLIDIANAN